MMQIACINETVFALKSDCLRFIDEKVVLNYTVGLVIKYSLGIKSLKLTQYNS